MSMPVRRRRSERRRRGRRGRIKDGGIREKDLRRRIRGLILEAVALKWWSNFKERCWNRSSLLPPTLTQEGAEGLTGSPSEVEGQSALETLVAVSLCEGTRYTTGSR